MAGSGFEINNDFTLHGKLNDIGRWYVTRFVLQAASALAPGALVLDAGAGECAYRKYFRHCQYRAVDAAVGDSNWNYRNLDYVASLDALPMGDNSFDAVVCTQVLEHLTRPRESILELHRVLRPGGRLFLTAPMAHGEHQMPHDFYRFTSSGLYWLCEQAGFEKITIAPFGGMFARWAYELPSITALLPQLRVAGRLTLKGCLFLPAKLAIKIAIRVLQLLALTVDRFDKQRKFPFGWSLVAVK
jgi:SAM-dependent methyltransferase